MQQSPARSAFRCMALLGTFLLMAMPAHAFTADSLDLAVHSNGDAVATFRFTLEGLIENAIPQSMLEEEILKGLTTSSEPPQLMAMDRSSATILLKNFASVTDVPQGTEYRTASMDFNKAEIALQNSALSSVITADFSPSRVTVVFPDSYSREFSDVSALPSLTHVVVDPSKTASARTSGNFGAVNVTTYPAGAQVYIDNVYAGESPAVFPDIPEGLHTVTIMKDGFLQTQATVTVVKGETTSVTGFLVYSTAPESSATYPVPGFAWPVTVIALAGCLLLVRFRR